MVFGHSRDYIENETEKETHHAGNKKERETEREK